MRVAVTGGAGFIGSHIVDRLVAESHEVLVIDDLSSGFRNNVPEEATLIEASISSLEADKAIADFRPEALIHAAAQISVRKSMEDPSFDADVNVKGILHLLTQLQRLSSPKPSVVFLSTGGAMYGDTEVVPTAESHVALPESLYGLHKRFGELYFDFWHRVHGIPYIALRLGNVYGPRQNPHGEAGVVAIFSERLLKGEPCTIFGDGSQTRDFVYVADVVEAVLLAVKSKGQVSGSDRIFNVATGVEVSVRELFDVMKEAAESSSELTLAPPRAGEQKRSVLDPSLLHNVLGWKAQQDLSSGISLTVEWFRKHIS